MEAVFPARGRRWRRNEPRQRHRTTPVTFAEIKVALSIETAHNEVDEEMENEEACGASVVSVASDAVERHSELEREFAEFRRRRARRGFERVGDGGDAPAPRVNAILASASPKTSASEPPTAAPS